MNGGKSLYVIRFYVHSERNYLVRKVGKRTSRDFLLELKKDYTLYVFNDVRRIFLCKERSERNVKIFLQVWQN